MAKRSRISNSGSRSLFTATAMKTHKLNNRVTTMRGGTRL
jgi:hypothetical protein